jgi:hypothetical protein
MLTSKERLSGVAVALLGRRGLLARRGRNRRRGGARALGIGLVGLLFEVLDLLVGDQCVHTCAHAKNGGRVVAGLVHVEAALHVLGRAVDAHALADDGGRSNSDGLLRRRRNVGWDAALIADLVISGFVL